jgi:retron-type reverse transcriptase
LQKLSSYFLAASVFKNFGKTLTSAIVNFFNKNNLFSNTQFGFRRGLSTSSAVLSFIDNIVRSFEKNNHYKAIFLDLSKAFDTVSHDILIKKLGYYKFSSSGISMITSYLSNRTQKVKVNVFFQKNLEQFTVFRKDPSSVPFFF